VTVIARAAVAGAVGAWTGVGRWWWLPPALAVICWRRVRIGRPERLAFVLAFALGALVGIAEAGQPTALPVGEVDLTGRVALDLGSNWGWSGLVSTAEGVVLVQADADPGPELIRVSGSSDGRVRRVAGRWILATVAADRVEQVGAGAVHQRAAGRLRERIIDQIQPADSDARGLLMGFLIGDISDVSSIVNEEMRRAGLSHLVAVSGSNVSLFLVGLVLVTAPLAIMPTARLVVVLNGLLVFGALTRWEPSVLRAAAMAALVAVGRFVGIPLEPVTALAVVAGASVLFEPGLAGSVGFQLSVLATAGLIAGARWWPGGGTAASILKATLAAQLAVAPLLLAVFGTVPLLSPVANLLAIPIVTAATSLAGIGAALGSGTIIVLAELLAQAVIVIARITAPWPQLDPTSFSLVAVVGAFWWRVRRGRAVVTLCAAIALCVVLVPARGAPDTGVIFFDVGQGDAAVVRMSGFTVLVDGGPEPARLADRLARYGINSLDLVIVTHVHADHSAGITGILGRVQIGRIWAVFEPHATPSSEQLLLRAGEVGVPVEAPALGSVLAVGTDTLEVIGPRRRYASPNDQSIVLVATLDGVRVLFSGDIEKVAQSEISVESIDVLKVPHQGAATSNRQWLIDHSGRVSVISVGPNAFGHPVGWVVQALEPATVYRTDVHGDVIVSVEAGTLTVRPLHEG
jgi:competence protein ComEC